MRDLEIRGAGSILGGQQHGHMEAVGYEMYIKLLSDAIAEEKGEKKPEDTAECLVDLRIPAHIPNNYISNINQRIEVYKKIAAVKNEEDASDVIDELIDRFGDVPKAVKGLIDVALLRNMAQNQGIFEITQRENMIMFYSKTLNMPRALRLVEEIKGRAVINAGEKPYIGVKLIKGDDPLFIIRESLKVMNEVENA